MTICCFKVGWILVIFNITLATVIIQCNAYSIKDCTLGKEADAKLTSVTVENCPQSGEFCPLVQGKNASITVDFETTSPFEAAIVRLYGKIGGLPLPFPLNPNNACGNYGFSCPVKANESKQLRISLPVQRTFPRLAVTVQLNLLDEKNRPIVCVEFPAKIVSSNA